MGALQDDRHAGIQHLVRDLNTLYRSLPALHEKDCEAEGFRWIEANAADESVFAWIREGNEGASPVVVLSNFTPVERAEWRCGLPLAGTWREVLNTDAGIYGGEGRGNMGKVIALEDGWHDQPASARVTIPPLSTVMLTYEGD